MNKIISLILLVININALALVPVHDGNLSIAPILEEIEETVEEEEEITVSSSSFNG